MPTKVCYSSKIAVLKGGISLAYCSIDYVYAALNSLQMKLMEIKQSENVIKKKSANQHYSASHK